MTVAQLSTQLTQEELTAWAAFFSLKNEEEEKAMERTRRKNQAGTMRGKYTATRLFYARTWPITA
jgi:hypothetical protein